MGIKHEVMDYIVLKKHTTSESDDVVYFVDVDGGKWDYSKTFATLFTNMGEVMRHVKNHKVKNWTVEVVTKPHPDDKPFVVPPRADVKVIETKTSKKQEKLKEKKQKPDTPTLFDNES